MIKPAHLLRVRAANVPRGNVANDSVSAIDIADGALSALGHEHARGPNALRAEAVSLVLAGTVDGADARRVQPGRRPLCKGR